MGLVLSTVTLNWPGCRFFLVRPDLAGHVAPGKRQSVHKRTWLDAEMGMKPEKKAPLAAGVQPLVKSPLTTLWLEPEAANEKTSTSPWAAVIELGLKVSPPLPTSMAMFLALACRAKAAVTRKVTREAIADW